MQRNWENLIIKTSLNWEGSRGAPDEFLIDAAQLKSISTPAFIY